MSADSSQRVHAVIAGRYVEGSVVDDDVEACYGPGPERVLTVDVDGAGTFRVPESSTMRVPDSDSTPSV
ncbi:hypothetical protein [Halobacterium hubeiense]|uniref:hypothetical protein n=1 Tax=Halobacterium hubeiense TaxID=1407499 RepID=UPI00117AA83E|nr:hypothetical protein [Halobacterium hubeiense]